MAGTGRCKAKGTERGCTRRYMVGNMHTNFKISNVRALWGKIYRVVMNASDALCKFFFLGYHGFPLRSSFLLFSIAYQLMVYIPSIS